MPSNSVNTCLHAQSGLTFWDRMDYSPPGSPSVEFSKQEYWSGWPFPSLGDLPHPGVEPESLACPALAGGLFTTVPPGKHTVKHTHTCNTLLGKVTIVMDAMKICNSHVLWFSLVPPIFLCYSKRSETFASCSENSFLTFSLFSRCLITVHSNCPNLDPIMLFFP